MNNALLITASWLAVAVHVVLGVVAYRRLMILPVLPLLNLVTALCVLAYWVQKWYGYAVKGITWYAVDQLVPLYAVLVCILAAFSLAGRYGGVVPHWFVFGFHTLVILATGLFFTFFRMDRLI